MEKRILAAKKRTIIGKKIKSLRKNGILPANVYGKKIKSEALEINLKEFENVFVKAGETGIVELNLDSEKRPVLIHNIQYDPVLRVPLHVDFYQVDLKEKVVARVPLEIIGEAVAVKDKTGVLLNLLSEIEVEALPGDLPEKILVDVGKLTAVNDTLKIKDLPLSDKIKVLTNIDTDIVKVAPLVSREAEEMAKEQAAAAAAAASAAAATAEGAPATESATAKPSEASPAAAPAKKE